MVQSQPAYRRGNMKRGKVGALILAMIMFSLAIWAGIWVRDIDFDYLFESYQYNFSDQPLRLGITEPIKTLDPARISQRIERVIGANLYEGLIKFDPVTLKPQPGLARSWKISDDARVFTFKLRKNAYFHTGRPITASDVKYSWERALDPEMQSPYAHLMYSIIGAKEKAEGKADAVVGIETRGDWEIRVTLEQPNIGFLSRFGIPVFWIVDKEIAEQAGKDYGRPGSFIIGSGPFMLDSWEAGQEIILKGNKNYWDHKPRLSEVIFKFVEAKEGLESFNRGELDYLDEIPLEKAKEVIEDPDLASQLLRTRLLDNYYYQFNLEAPVLGKSPLLRKALNYAIDRTKIIDDLFGGIGYPMESLIPPGVFDYKPDPFPYKFDRDQAGYLLSKAGYPGGDGLPVLEIAYNNLDSHRIIAEEIKQQLKQIGVQVKLKPVEWEEYKIALAEGKYDCFRGGWSWDYPDPDDLFFFNFHSSQISNTNYLFYNNQQVDTWLNAARMEKTNYAQRMDYYHQVEKQVVAEAPLLWLFTWERVALVNPRVYNLKITAMDLIPLHKVGLLGED